MSRFPDWSAYAAHASRSHLYNLRRAKRRLEDQGNLRIDWCRTPPDVDVVLTWAWRNKQAWAKARRIDTDFLRDDSVPRFFMELARRVDLGTNPLVSFVRLDDDILAAQINLVGEKVFELLFTTFSASQARWSPGDLLIQHSFQWAIAHGLDYDFRVLRADYKERVSDKVTFYSTYEIALTPIARLVGPVDSRIRPFVRRARRAPGKALQLLQLFAGKVRRRAAIYISDARQISTDRSLGIRTHVSLPRTSPNPSQVNKRYEPLRYEALEILRDNANIGPDEILYDIGCGKGRALCFFARLNLKKIVGVEYLPELADVARRNVSLLRNRLSTVEVITGDAAAMNYDDGTVFLLYNPFGEPVMGAFLKVLKASLRRRPRSIRLIYANPVCKDSIVQVFGRQRLDFEVPYGPHRCPVAIWEIAAVDATRTREPGKAGTMKSANPPPTEAVTRSG